MTLTPSDFEVFTQPPESLGVGKLNAVVRALREALYQEKLKGRTLLGRVYEWTANYPLGNGEDALVAEQLY